MATVIYKSNCDSLDEKSMRCKHFFTKVVRILTKGDATGFKPGSRRIRIALRREKPIDIFHRDRGEHEG